MAKNNRVHRWQMDTPYQNAILLEYLIANTKVVNGCWEWQRHFCRGGYGSMQLKLSSAKAKTVNTHRLIYKVLYGELSTEICVCHHCDNRKCINPAHLFIGTHKDNLRDMYSKGRSNPGRAFGVANGLAKLNDDKAKEIYRRCFNEKILYLAREFGVTPRVIRLIKLKETWKHIHV